MNTDVRVTACRTLFLPVATRIPLRFGSETLTGVTCARTVVEVEDARGRRARGWGETPLSATWVWPGTIPYTERDTALRDFCLNVAEAMAGFPEQGHPMELGHIFMEELLPGLWRGFNRGRDGQAALPWLAALVCFSSLDLAVHDAYGILHRRFAYDTYSGTFMNRDLAWYFGADAGRDFSGLYPCDFLEPMRPALIAWHLVGGEDRLDQGDLQGDEPDDGIPVLLDEWIRRDGLRCLKVKLGGVDQEADFARLAKVGEIGGENGVRWLCADFNCMVEEPAYVEAMLDRIQQDLPWLDRMLLYLEQPFPRDLRSRPLRVEHLGKRKPLFMDESAHDWRHVRFGQGLGWSGVALKTCKTQTGALLSLCWAKANALPVMVQDLTNPMLAMIPHALLAAHAGTLMGLETNAMQFYPDASLPESRVHPGLYVRQNGRIRLDTIGKAGFGYRIEEMDRPAPD